MSITVIEKAIVPEYDGTNVGQHFWPRNHIAAIIGRSSCLGLVGCLQECVDLLGSCELIVCGLVLYFEGVWTSSWRVHLCADKRD
jgi:hypothetical protein